MPRKKAKPRKRTNSGKDRIVQELKQVETYEYLLVEYLKEISNEMTYLITMVVSLFLYIMLDLLPLTESVDYGMLRLILVLLIVGGFGLFGLSNITKRRIERRFERMFL